MPRGCLPPPLRTPIPACFFEHKALYRSVIGQVPDEYYTVEIGKAHLVKEGDQATVVTYGMGVHWAKRVMESLDVRVDLLDLRTLLPWDKEAVEKSVKKTNKVMILHEDCLTGGIGAEIAAWISEHCFECLDAPVMREGSLDTPVPFAANLEENFLPENRFKDKLMALLAY